MPSQFAHQVMEVPIASLQGLNIQRGIFWKADNVAHVFTLVGYCPSTLPYFIALCNDLCARVPEVNPSEITCGKVMNSRFVKGFTLVLAELKGPKRIPTGFQEWKELEFTY